MEDERDLLVFTDDDGNEIQMEVVDYFDYEDEEYAMLVEAAAHDHEHDEDGACCGGDEEKDIYIMKVVIEGDTEEFVPVSEEKMDELIQAIQDMYDDEDEDDEEDKDE